MKYSEQVDVRKALVQVDLCLDYFNERMRVDHYYGNAEALHGVLEEYQEKESFTKWIVKAKREDFETFLRLGYTLEGTVPKYFKGSTAYFFTKYFNIGRRNSQDWLEEDVILKNVYERKNTKKEVSIPENFTMRIAVQKDSLALANMYGEIFKVYPTPLNDPSYIEKTMHHDTLYFIVEDEFGTIVSAASAEMDVPNRNAELTNCATLPSFRKYGLMKLLLSHLENPLRERGIYCAYTIARAMSFGMNAAFYDLGYDYTGRLTNNCYIFESIEDMNLWAKDLVK